MIDPVYQKVIIADEMDSIRYYAWEIGEMKGMIERETDERMMQYWEYFLSIAETEMELANERLTKFRKELTDYELQRG